jgi:hypothetical protein
MLEKADDNNLQSRLIKFLLLCVLLSRAVLFDVKCYFFMLSLLGKDDSLNLKGLKFFITIPEPECH